MAIHEVFVNMNSAFGFFFSTSHFLSLVGSHRPFVCANITLYCLVGILALSLFLYMGSMKELLQILQEVLQIVRVSHVKEWRGFGERLIGYEGLGA